MKKRFQMQDLDCANCARKMEEAIRKLPGVREAKISFLTQKLTVDAEEEKFEEIMVRVVKECAKVEPDCKVILS